MTNFDATADLLDMHEDYRVLRRIGKSETWGLKHKSTEVRQAVFVDVETTGLDIDNDEIIEIGIVPFNYDLGTGEIIWVDEDDALSQFRDPGVPIPGETTKIHGITDDMVRGRSIDEDKLNQLVSAANLIISHNSAFDRPMVERVFPIFREKPWACSLTDIDWRDEGFGAGKLDYLLMQFGYFYEGHRALNDCLAGTFLLNQILPNSGKRVMATLLSNARKPLFAIRAIDSPFEAKDKLRSRGYRWDPGSDVTEKAWWIIVPNAQTELAWLKENIYQGEVNLPVKEITALNRFSKRIWT